ncbi:hypothetical protein JQ597_14250 [Bradyrhizobium sp. AUGA SZCCT0177]|uniref:hypothetical protein n=1 Tax=unclassified Bradyrhizobium TaxID=2631580 RepID=UPI001BAB42CB|nr:MULTISPECIES: hypothetical protein [unclassified Bradyrhizobium]MBR1231043.1 hypothetical protein [Bradyrhizobium sp. AUGA SZCCT0182]MBR1283205.1 hypothetical protein [Bradyrhizobium sp. AUGA SZCCT0177]
MTDWLFEAPGGVTDFRNPRNWHNAMAEEARGIVRQLVADIVKKNPGDVTDDEIAEHAPTLGYIDPATTPPSSPGQTVNIASWPAFPRAVTRRKPWLDFKPVTGDNDGTRRAAEHLGDEDHRPGVFVDQNDCVLHLPVRHRQDEYLEWVGRRNTDGKLSKAIFVAEGYDYYSELFEHDEGRALELYRDFTEDSTIRVDDLRARHGIYRRLPNGSRLTVAEPGSFNPRNRFNINPGIVHLSHRANSLGAEVNLAGVSGILRLKADGTILDGTNPEELLCCCEGGNPNRNSDPLISQQAYGLVRNNKRYTLANPVGLYIASINHQRVQTRGGEDLTPDWWTVVRGNGLDKPSTSRVLRLELAPPKNSKLTLEDLEVDGEPVRFVGQLADLLQVHLFVTVWDREHGSENPSLPCTGTCCRRHGTQQLVITNDTCAPDFDLAFPGLIKDPAAIVASTHNLAAVAATAPLDKGR